MQCNPRHDYPGAHRENGQPPMRREARQSPSQFGERETMLMLDPSDRGKKINPAAPTIRNSSIIASREGASRT